MSSLLLALATCAAPVPHARPADRPTRADLPGYWELSWADDEFRGWALFRDDGTFEARYSPLVEWDAGGNPVEAAWPSHYGTWAVEGGTLLLHERGWGGCGEPTSYQVDLRRSPAGWDGRCGGPTTYRLRRPARH